MQKNVYKYHYRPAYGSDELLLEFYEGVEKERFFSDILETISEINPKVESVEDLWLNDSVRWNIISEIGRFDLSIDIWDHAFIMAENNQKCLEKINNILLVNKLFEKIEVEFKEYRLPKK